MKKLIMIFVMALFTFAFALPEAQAGVVPAVETGVVPSSKEKAGKIIKKQIKEVRKEFRTEMKGMNKAEKKAFVVDKINQNKVEIGNVKYLIIALICFLIAGVAWVLPAPIDLIISTIFGIVAVVFLILWLIDILQSI